MGIGVGDNVLGSGLLSVLIGHALKWWSEWHGQVVDGFNQYTFSN